MWALLYRLASPRMFVAYSRTLIPICLALAAIMFAFGLIDGLFLVPADKWQGDGFRIIYIHVPSAFFSLTLYLFMAFCAVLTLVWRIKLAALMMHSTARLGAWLTLLALVTGALWGKPMWGTYWIWDARLTSELVLLFIYLGIISLKKAISHDASADRAVALLVIIGLVDIPLIHFSVQWWSTLHQPSSLSLVSSSIAPVMLYPLLAMLGAYGFYCAALLINTARCELIIKERETQWVKSLIT